MEKNTEYGALVILSASSYGRGSTPIKDGETTTGNKTGVVMRINKEWVAAATDKATITSMENSAKRYKDVYTNELEGYNPTRAKYIEKIGDAIATVSSWHGSTSSTWLSGQSGYNYSCLVRAYSGSVFSYYGYGLKTQFPSDLGNPAQCGDGTFNKEWHSRAVVVVGSGV